MLQVGHDAASSVHTPQQQQAAQWSSLRGAATGVAQAAASSGTALHRQRRDWPLAVVPALSAAKVQSLLLELQGSLRPAEHATPTLQPAGQLPALHTHPCAIRPAAPVATQPRLAVQLQPLQAVPFRLPSPAPSTGLPIGAEWPSAVSIDSSALLPSRQQPATGESQLSSVLLSYLHQLALDHPAARQAAATNVTALPQDARRHLTYQPAPRMQLQQLLSTLLGASQRPAATPKRKLARSQPAVSSALACWQPELDQFAPPSLSRQPAAPGQHVAGHSAEIMPASTSGRPASASTCGLIMASAEHSDMKRPRVSMANLPAAVCHVCEGSIADAHGAHPVCHITRLDKRMHTEGNVCLVCIDICLSFMNNSQQPSSISKYCAAHVTALFCHIQCRSCHRCKFSGVDMHWPMSSHIPPQLHTLKPRTSDSAPSVQCMQNRQAGQACIVHVPRHQPSPYYKRFSLVAWVVGAALLHNTQLPTRPATWLQSCLCCMALQMYLCKPLMIASIVMQPHMPALWRPSQPRQPAAQVLHAPVRPLLSQPVCPSLPAHTFAGARISSVLFGRRLPLPSTLLRALWRLWRLCGDDAVHSLPCGLPHAVGVLTYMLSTWTHAVWLAALLFLVCHARCNPAQPVLTCKECITYSLY